MRQAIISTYDGLVDWGLYESLGLDELNRADHVQS